MTLNGLHPHLTRSTHDLFPPHLRAFTPHFPRTYEPFPLFLSPRKDLRPSPDSQGCCISIAFVGRREKNVRKLYPRVFVHQVTQDAVPRSPFTEVAPVALGASRVETRAISSKKAMSISRSLTRTSLSRGSLLRF